MKMNAVVRRRARGRLRLKYSVSKIQRSVSSLSQVPINLLAKLIFSLKYPPLLNGNFLQEELQWTGSSSAKKSSIYIVFHSFLFSFSLRRPVHAFLPPIL